MTREYKQMWNISGFSCVMSGLSIKRSTAFYKSDWLVLEKAKLSFF